ncbi:Alpha/Beta hydrolase protein [Mycena sp. CBHHK59/15]|nr:Alpha/Beta hydrolase protein [Mycena sp. CBHHK59/15]
MFSTSFVLLTAFTAVLGAPAPFVRSKARAAPAAVTALSASDLSALDPFTQFARAAYCPVDKLMAWDCGEACDATPASRQPLPAEWETRSSSSFNSLVGYYPKSNSVIVSHQGTDPVKLMSDLTDLNVFKGELNSTLFPGDLPAGTEVHSGFRDEHALTADEIQAEVKRLIAEKGATQVGHSLGGALAELDALSLRLNLPTSVGVNAVTFGTPRVGNQEFVQFFDSQVTDFKRVNNENDLVPTVPGRFLGFVHPQGEIHIVDDSTGDIVACPGNDDATDAKCQIKTVPSILSGNIINHLGPYNGIFIGSIFCT